MALKTILNLDADTGANVIGNEATPLLELSNSSTGPGLKVDNLVATSGATIASLTTSGTLVADALDINGAILAANASVSAINIRGASVASGATFNFSGDALKSVTTILATTGGAAGTQAIRIVKVDGTFGWIPVYPDAAVTATAI